jgi:asparagine synthase (glutamine-hydrolysing)
MCGIYGRLDLLGQPIAPIPADRLAIGRLAHRGPDDEGCYYGSLVFLGVRRLAVVDLVTGAQPVTNEDRTVSVIFNGEIYNFAELRRELIGRGHRFSSAGDTEVIVHGWEEWGEGLLDRLNGMFAIAVWDERRRTLWLVRDRLGVKPLYYWRDRQTLLFGSEIKALLAHPDVAPAIDTHGLLNYLTYGHAVAPDTIYRGIKKLMPGHLLRASQGELEIREWWDVVPDEDHALSGKDAAAEVRRLLDDSVRMRMVADVPVGAFLSGGLDSSAIVALMSRHASGPVRTFSVGFEGGAAYDELADARVVAAHCRTEHHEMRIASRQLAETIETLVYHFDEPFGDAACFPTYLVSRLARNHVTVALTGEGADELFGGYRRYWADRWLRALTTATAGYGARVLSPVIGALPRFRRIKQLVQAGRVADAPSRYAQLLRVFSADALVELVDARLTQAARAYDAVEIYRRRLAAASDADDLNRLMYADIKTWLADTYLEKVDKASMAVSLEARVPMLDFRLVEWAMRIPARHKVRGTTTKQVLRRAVSDLLPVATLRKPKHGFSVPTDPWFRGELKDFAYEVLLDPRTRQRGFFNAAAVERLWREHQAGTAVRDGHLWLLLNFELWARQYLDQRVAA